jgi:hypothetical protein
MFATFAAVVNVKFCVAAPPGARDGTAKAPHATSIAAHTNSARDAN